MSVDASVERKNKIRQIVGQRLPKAATLADDAVLFSSGKIDSLNILDVIIELESAFGISIPGAEIQLTDLDSVLLIEETVLRFGGH